MKKEKPGRTYYILFIYVHLHKPHANPTKSRVIPKNQEVCRLGHKRGNCLKRLYLDPQILLVHANTIKPKGYVTWRVKKRLTQKGLFWGQDILKHPIYVYIPVIIPVRRWSQWGGLGWGGVGWGGDDDVPCT